MKKSIRKSLIGVAQSAILSLSTIIIMSGCNQNRKDAILFCGNPGSGKTSLLNAIMDDNIFNVEQRVDGTAVTIEVESITKGDFFYVDTPGLADNNQQAVVAEQIEEALRKNKNYKIVFVVSFADGRPMSPADINTIDTICKAVEVNFEYGIIFNKVPGQFIRKAKRSEKNIYAEYIKKLHRGTNHYTIIEMDYKIMSGAASSFEKSPKEELMKLITNIPATYISKENVKKVDGRSLVQKKEDVQKLNTTLASMGVGGFLGAAVGTGLIIGGYVEIAPVSVPLSLAYGAWALTGPTLSFTTEMLGAGVATGAAVGGAAAGLVGLGLAKAMDKISGEKMRKTKIRKINDI